MNTDMHVCCHKLVSTKPEAVCIYPPHTYFHNTHARMHAHAHTHTRSTDCTLIIICLSEILSHIHLFIGLFISVFIILWTDFLFICKLGSEGREAEHSFLMRAVINSEQACPSLPLSDCLSSSAHQSEFLPDSSSLHLFFFSIPLFLTLSLHHP